MTAYGSDYSPAPDQYTSAGFSASDFAASSGSFVDTGSQNATSPGCDPYAPQQTDSLTAAKDVAGFGSADAACLVPGAVVAPQDTAVVPDHSVTQETPVVVQQTAPPSDPALDLLNPLDPLSPLNPFNPLSPWSIYNQNGVNNTSTYTTSGPNTTSSGASVVVPRKRSPAGKIEGDSEADVESVVAPKSTQSTADADPENATQDATPAQRDLKEGALAVMMRQHKIAVTCKENDLPDVMETLREECDDVQRVTAMKHGMDPEKASEHSFLGNLARAPIQNVGAFIKDVCHGVTEAQGKALDEIDNRLATRAGIRGGDSEKVSSEEKQSSQRGL